MLSTRFVHESGSCVSAKLTYREGEEVQYIVTLLPEEDLSAFYMAFRHLYLEKAISIFLRVANIIANKSNSIPARNTIDVFKRQWHGVIESTGWQISINEMELTGGCLSDIWFNAHYFHSDEKKAESLKQIQTILSKDFSHFLLVNDVVEATGAAIKLYESLNIPE